MISSFNGTFNILGQFTSSNRAFNITDTQSVRLAISKIQSPDICYLNGSNDKINFDIRQAFASGIILTDRSSSGSNTFKIENLFITNIVPNAFDINNTGKLFVRLDTTQDPDNINASGPLFLVDGASTKLYGRFGIMKLSRTLTSQNGGYQNFNINEIVIDGAPVFLYPNSTTSIKTDIYAQSIEHGSSQIIYYNNTSLNSRITMKVLRTVSTSGDFIYELLSGSFGTINCDCDYIETSNVLRNSGNTNFSLRSQTINISDQVVVHQALGTTVIEYSSYNAIYKGSFPSALMKITSPGFVLIGGRSKIHGQNITDTFSFIEISQGTNTPLEPYGSISINKDSIDANNINGFTFLKLPATDNIITETIDLKLGSILLSGNLITNTGLTSFSGQVDSIIWNPSVAINLVELGTGATGTYPPDRSTLMDLKASSIVVKDTNVIGAALPTPGYDSDVAISVTGFTGRVNETGPEGTIQPVSAIISYFSRNNEESLNIQGYQLRWKVDNVINQNSKIAATYHGSAFGTSDYRYNRYTDLNQSEDIKAWNVWIDQAPITFVDQSPGQPVEHKIRTGQHRCYNPHIIGNTNRSLKFPAASLTIKGKHSNSITYNDSSLIYASNIDTSISRLKNTQFFSSETDGRTVVAPNGLNLQTVGILSTTNTLPEIGVSFENTGGINGETNIVTRE